MPHSDPPMPLLASLETDFSEAHLPAHLAPFISQFTHPGCFSSHGMLSDS
jgi:hypothetical protein